MKIALYARATADGGEPVDQILAGLAAHATRKGWEVVLQTADQAPGPGAPKKSLSRLLQFIRANAIQGILVRSLSQLARSLRHLVDLGQQLAAQGVALIALEDDLDTTDLASALRWRDWLETSTRLDRQLRAEAAKLAHQRSPGKRWGRPPVAVNPVELLDLWRGRGGRRPLSQRELAARLGVSKTTIRKHLVDLREAGELLDQARAGRLAAEQRRRGRKANPLNDDDLTAAWRATPSCATVARTLHVRRRRVETRLRELGLLSEG
ncbi:MAG TPA: recombinase family protein [Thermoanaerobaculia bacterium]|nr:recombinase family protein [Thermoanaerobaculia bacterium]